MAKLTRGGVCYDLNDTPFIAKINDTSYHFSSNYNLEKFLRLREEHQEKIQISLSKRFGIVVKQNLLADIVLYKSIEKRGFLIEADGIKFTCPNTITLSGERLIVKN